jgi:hypothetical protein
LSFSIVFFIFSNIQYIMRASPPPSPDISCPIVSVLTTCNTVYLY